MATEEVDITSYRFFLFFFCVIYGLVRYDIRSPPARNLFRGIYCLDKRHSLEFLKNLFLNSYKQQSYSFRTVLFIQIVNI
nr:MAG TPA: hypothetical protein [Caudoviricetes sp.]